ncbi:MAG: type II secretion system F family protein [Planctomycetes bacterium]|nr:type II secretion system F family protein [Planctomycetota bacterium]
MSDKLKARRERLAEKASGPGAAEPSAQRRSLGHVARKAKVLFTLQFATLQDAGLPVLRSLKVLENQMESGAMKRVVGEISSDVEAGSSLSEAMAKHPSVFDDLYVNMIRAGEASGALTIICNRLAGFMEKAEALRRRIRGAMVYPMMVMLIAIAIVTFIMLFVVPKFEDAFAQLRGELPGMTRFLIDTSRWLVDHWYLLLALPLAVWSTLVMLGRSPSGRHFLDRVRLKLPLVGGIIQRSQVARFARTLGTLSSSGVPLLQALEITGEASGNVVMREAVDAVKVAVKEGEPIARPMGECGFFDDIVVNMVDVGEETGELDRMLMKIADNNDTEVDVRVAAMTAVLEPLLIVTMAVIVGFIVVSLYLPLLKLQELIGK